MDMCEKSHSSDLPSEFNEPLTRGRHDGGIAVLDAPYELGRRHALEAEERLRNRVRELTADVRELTKKGSWQ
jgi:hypothetical protein